MSESTREPELRDYLRMVWRRRRMILAVVVAAVAAAVVASLFNAATYEARATLVLQDQTSDPFAQPTVQINQDREVQTEIEVFNGGAVEDQVRQLIGAAPDVAVDPLGQTNAFTVTARAPQPGQAADIANAYARAYIEVTRTQAVDDLQAGAAQLRNKVADLQTRIDQLAPVGDGDPSPTATVARDALINQAAGFQQKADDIEVSAGLQQGRARVSTPATPDATPVAPRPVRSAVLALVLGLILGLGTALLIEYLDDSITSKEALEDALGGAPVLGIIPVDTAVRPGVSRVASIEAPMSGSAEAYRSLRTAVQFLGLERETTVVLVTSPRLGDGKTTTAVNLAVSMAKSGQRVVLAGFDLRRPRFHEFLDVDETVGLTSVITGDTTLVDALQPVREVEGLEVLASGPLPPNPAEVLATRHVAEVLATLRTGFDTVVIDCPPLLPVTDAAVLAPLADVVLLVARAGSTGVHDLERSLETLRQVQAPPAGSVFNAVTAEFGGYGYGYGYGSTRGVEAADGAPDRART